MDIQVFRNDAAEIAKITAAGKKLIASLRNEVEVQFKNHFKFGKESTETRLFLDFYGIQLRLSIEIRWNKEVLIPTIVVHQLTENEPKERNVFEVEFDKQGNIGRRTPEEVLPFLVKTIFSKLVSEGTVLTP
jgi:hypothetical protein